MLRFSKRVHIECAQFLNMRFIFRHRPCNMFPKLWPVVEFE